jgi:streptomycin 6-kinase
MLDLPIDFVRNIRNSFGADGEQFLTDLPDLLDEAARRWELTIGGPFLLSYNYVTAAKRADGTDVVVKIGVPNRELTSEIEALRLYDGQGAVRLIDSDAERGMLLEERIRPGTMLLEMQDDERGTEIAAGIMRALWRPVPTPAPLLSPHFPRNSVKNGGMKEGGVGFIRLIDWFGAFQKLRQQYYGGTGPLPRKVFETAEGLVADFFAENEPPVVLHGDFQHYNVLQTTDGWRAIDPKGVIGPRGYEVGPWLVNPRREFFEGPGAEQRTERRLAILAEQLGMERGRIRGWGIAHAVLSAVWQLDGSGGGSLDWIQRCTHVLMSTPE